MARALRDVQRSIDEERALLNSGNDNAVAGAGMRQLSRQDMEGIAGSFVAARAAARALPSFPGTIPPDLATAYTVQELAIARWPDRVVGWKVGYIAPGRRDDSGDERLLGPIFASQVWTDADAELPVFAGGFGAVEAEYVIKLETDAPADRLDWSPEQAAEHPATLWLGIEIASSPLATINALGPRVVVSDFGNNNGLLLGPEVRNWRDISEQELRAETWIDGVRVGSGGATMLPGGLRAAYAFALSRSARRGRPLKAGDLIASGNATGIHDIVPGQLAEVRFDGYGILRGRAVAARARQDVAAHGSGE
jgi:2-keto-4-pentenoate hydratase